MYLKEDGCYAKGLHVKCVNEVESIFHEPAHSNVPVSHMMVEEHVSQGNSCKHYGVYDLLNFDHMTASSMKYQSFQYTEVGTGTKYFMRQYHSEER